MTKYAFLIDINTTLWLINGSSHLSSKYFGRRHFPMDSKAFIFFRKKLNKTQKQIAQLLGTSLKAIHSYEQGWRSVPPSVERQIFFLVSRTSEIKKHRKTCWAIKKCSPDQKAQCPAWEFKAGKLCWFINGTICEGAVQKNWKEKMKICRSCEVFQTYFNLKRKSFLPT